MDFKFVPTTPAHLPQLAELFTECFSPKPAGEPMDSRLMAWKYYNAHPFRPGPRSYVVQEDNEITAHVGMAPVRFATRNGVVESIQFLDWMATPRVPGTGMMAYRESLDVVETVLAVGGSEQAQRLLPKIGWLRTVPEMRMYARPLRVAVTPAQPPYSRVKTPVKFARNLWWSLVPHLPSSAGWRCCPVPLLTTVWMPHGDFIPIERTAGWLNFHLTCPAVRFEANSLERNGQPAGHALLAYAGPQVRIADFVIDSMDEEQWTQACSALLRMVAGLPACREIAAASSLPFLQRVYERCGFRYRASMQVYLGDPKNRFAPNDLLELSLLTGDSAYLINDDNLLWC